jgi:hypothetical protein
MAMENKSGSKTKPTKQPNPPPPKSSNANEGEGNRSADRRYRESAARHAGSGRSPQAADDARRALEGDEADELRHAEQVGKSKSRVDEPEEWPDDPEIDVDEDDELDRDRD